MKQEPSRFLDKVGPVAGWLGGGMAAGATSARRAPAVGAVPRGMPRLKRGFDLVFCVLSMPVWLLLMLVALAAVLIGSGRPTLYVSPRQVYRRTVVRVVKLRTMVRDAAAIATRATVPIESQRFLNIRVDSPLYTPVGRWIERFNLTEFPQFFHVLAGTMSIIGNRPLPTDVVAALLEVYPYAEDRFLTRAGLTGPVQLVGRYVLSDADRLMLEIEYCRHCTERYSMRLDLMIALNTVLILARLRRPLTVGQVRKCMETWTRPLIPGREGA